MPSGIRRGQHLATARTWLWFGPLTAIRIPAPTARPVAIPRCDVAMHNIDARASAEPRVPAVTARSSGPRFVIRTLVMKTETIAATRCHPKAAMKALIVRPKSTRISTNQLSPPRVWRLSRAQSVRCQTRPTVMSRPNAQQVASRTGGCWSAIEIRRTPAHSLSRRRTKWAEKFTSMTHHIVTPMAFVSPSHSRNFIFDSDTDSDRRAEGGRVTCMRRRRMVGAGGWDERKIGSLGRRALPT